LLKERRVGVEEWLSHSTKPLQGKACVPHAQANLAAAAEMQLRAELPAAIASGQLVPYFQPIVALGSGQLRAAEALVRWQHPTRGLISPAEFLPLLQDMALMPRLTELMFDAVLRQQRSWSDDGYSVTVSVNVPPQCIADTEFPDSVAERLSEHGFGKPALIVEVTEGVAAEPMSSGVLAALHALGVLVAIDDFGAGDSSLRRLGDLPVQLIKLDLSLIRPLVENPTFRTIVGLAIELAHELGAQVVAEGIESKAAEELLLSLGCDFGQGFLYAHAMPADEFLDWMHGHGRPVARAGRRQQREAVQSAQPGPSVDPQSRPSNVRSVGSLLRAAVASVGGGALAFALAVLGVYGLWQFGRWGGRAHQALIGDLAFVPMVGAAVTLAVRVSRRRDLVVATRRAWRLLALSLSMYLLGDLLELVYEAVQHVRLYSVASGVAYLCVYPLALACLFSFPSQRRSPGERLRLSLDLAIVFAGCVTAIWYVVLGPAIAASNGLKLIDVVTLASAAGDGVLLFALVALITRGVPRSSLAALRLLAAGTCVFVAADLLFGYVVAHGGYLGGDRVDTVWLVAMTLMFLGAACQLRAHSQPALTTTRQTPALRFHLLPYLAVAAIYGLLIVVALGRVALYPLGGLLAGAALLTALVSARQVIAMWDNRRLAARYHALATEDSLTGLANRRHCLELGEASFAAAQRSDLPLACLMVDIDHFKEVNDTHGHACGDRVLAALARSCRRHVRPGDIVGRYGGDELVVLLPGETAEAAAQVASRLLSRSGEAADLEGAGVEFSFSVGVAEARGCRSFDALLARADLALYEAKRAGRGVARTFRGIDEAQLEMTALVGAQAGASWLSDGER
jgi:diguanylate cyclase (GGDEF)-like protein